MSIYMINSFIYIIKAPIAIVISPKVSGITPLSNNKTCNSLQEKPFLTEKFLYTQVNVSLYY